MKFFGSAVSAERLAQAHLVLDCISLFVAVAAGATFLGYPLGFDTGLAALTLYVAWRAATGLLQHYELGRRREFVDDFALVSVMTLGMVLGIYVLRWILGPGASVPEASVFFMMFWPLVLLSRLVVFRPLFIQAVPVEDVLIVGIGPLGRVTGEDLKRSRVRRNVLGYLAFPQDTQQALVRDPILGSACDLELILRRHPVSEVYLAGNPTRDGEAMQAAVEACERLGIPFALPAYGFRMGRARAVASDAIADGYLHYLSVDPKPYQMALKRLFDIAASSLALLLLSPLLAAVAVAIKLTSKGPLFFKQQRVGLYGKPFHVLKFRSMVVNAEQLKSALEKLNEQTGPVFKMKNDPRVTRIGRFIRKFSIDELPQLINVLRGDMSIVGPRPPVPSEVAKYEAWQRRRLSVRPGLTCIWQVSGRNQISFEQWMYLDMQYIDHWKLAKDFDLILRTVPVVLTGRGAS